MLGLGNTLSGGAALSTAFTAASISDLDLWYDFSLLSGSDGDDVEVYTYVKLDENGRWKKTALSPEICNEDQTVHLDGEIKEATIELSDEDNNRYNSQSYTVSSSNTWEKKIVNFPADTTGAFDNDNAKSLTINFWGGGENLTEEGLAELDDINKIVRDAVESYRSQQEVEEPRIDDKTVEEKIEEDDNKVNPERAVPKESLVPINERPNININETKE